MSGLRCPMSVFQYKTGLFSLVQMCSLSQAHSSRHPVVRLPAFSSLPEGRSKCCETPPEARTPRVHWVPVSALTSLISPSCDPPEGLSDRRDLHPSSLHKAFSLPEAEASRTTPAEARGVLNAESSCTLVSENRNPQSPLRAEPHNAYFSRQRTRREGVPSR